MFMKSTPAPFRLKRHIFAKRARWEPTLNKWEFQSGWSRRHSGLRELVGYDSFPDGIRTFKELEEGPDYFMREAKQSRQMNFQELQNLHRRLAAQGLRHRLLAGAAQQEILGADVRASSWRWSRFPSRFWPATAARWPESASAWRLAIAYWSVDKLFEQVGALGQLPPQMAAWSPDVLFSLAGLYFLVRMRT